MNTTTLKNETFGCELGGYYQDFNAVDEPAKHERLFPGIPAGKYPACYTGQNMERVTRECSLTKIVDLNSLSTTTSASDDELEARQIEELDQHGQPVMEQVGSRYELRVNQSNGQISTEEAPVMQPKMRPLTDQELTELKEQRNRQLDELEKVTVKEVTGEA